MFKDDFTQTNNHLNRLNYLYLYKERERSIQICPRCSSTNFIKHGTYNDIQRFKCKSKECACTFSAATSSPWRYSKKSITLWIKYLELMMQGKSIRYCAESLNINIATSFYWRHKILSVKNSFVEPKTLTTCVEMFKTNFKQNFKGCRKITSTDRRNIWVASAIDVNNNLISIPVSESHFNYPLAKKLLYSKIDSKAFVNSYADNFLARLARNHNKKLKASTSENSNVIKSFSINIRRWINKFRGVATKYLWSYLSWYIIIFKNLHNNIIELIKCLNLENTFNRNKDFIKTTVCIP